MVCQNRVDMLAPLPAPKLQELNQIAERHLAANRVGMKVALVLTPQLFGGIGLGLWAVIPSPFGFYVGGSIAGAGLLLLLFLVWYQRRTATRRPFVALVTIGQWQRVTHEYGGEAQSVSVQIHQAASLHAQGYGEELTDYRGASRTFVVASPSAFNAVPPGGQAQVLCMATGEVIAIDVGDRVLSG